YGIRLTPLRVPRKDREKQANSFIFTGRSKDFNEAIQLHPETAEAYGWLAWLLAMCPTEELRNGKRAVVLATKACELTEWQSGWQLNTLAAAYAEVGQFDEACRYQAKAFEDPAYQGSDGDEFRQRLELYKQKKSRQSAVASSWEH